MRGTSLAGSSAARLDRMRPAALARALGVTRVARVTGLDRAGVEVACAVRPGGHVLQVTNGKGRTAREAALGALLEAAELACAERVDPTDLRWAAPGALRARGVAHVAPAALGELGGAWGDGAVLAWREGTDLVSGEAVLVPAGAVHVPPPGGPLLGLAAVRWTSNGMGAHRSWDRALLHALLEAAERDALARALPEGWTEAEVAARRVPGRALRAAAPAVAALVERMARRGLDVHLFDLRPSARALPLAGALLVDRGHAPVPLTAGYACRLDPAAALEAALLEAAQSRLTDIHGAREDVAGADRDGAERLREACDDAARRGAPTLTPPLSRRRERARNRSGHPFPAPSPPQGEGAGVRGRRGASSDADRAIAAVLDHLRADGVEQVVALDLAPADLGVHVAKVVAPGLLLSELL